MPAPAIAPLAETDLDQASALVRECGWNQVADDWRIFLRRGAAFQVRDAAGGLAATAAILPYGRFGWISMVLVSQAQRRQGLATALLDRCVAELRQRDLVPVLDATPAGREVYRGLGFRDGWGLTRWRRTQAAPLPAVASTDLVLRALADSDWRAIAERDKQAFGADRTGLLRSLAQRSTGFACIAERNGRIAGYLLGRNGRVATHIGPVIADDESVAVALVAQALAALDGPVLVDALERHTAFAAWLQAAGFAVERGYTRMALGSDAAFGDAGCTIAIAGPELG